MATNNTRPQVPVTNTVENTETTMPEKMVIVKIERHNKDDDSEFVSVNERTWQIKKGVEVEVPECVAEVLHNRDVAFLEKYEYEEKISK